jgi:ribonuclease H / adenosylcobalamin/alpha-ribazole phosphatase
LPIAETTLSELRTAIDQHQPRRAFCSPASRTQQTLAVVGRTPNVDARLWEIDYGQLDGLTVAQARRQFPEIFQAWQLGHDPRLPDGESVADVATRVHEFVRVVWAHGQGNSLVCTHNVVMRCLLGDTLGVPRAEQHRLQIPHLRPITLIQTQQHGLFVDVPEELEPLIFQSWEPKPLLEAA